MKVAWIGVLTVFFLGQTTHSATEAESRARHAMIATANSLATEVGIEVLKKGGNAVDAAVAVRFVLAVTWPEAGNLGGGGFMLIRRADGRTEILDYRETAPAAATRDMYLDGEGKVIPDSSTVGYRAVGVPGTVAGLALAHERHGKLKWRELLEPARRLADEGFVVNHATSASIGSESALLSKFDESRRIFLKDGKAPPEGEKLRQKDLAATLKRIELKGAQDFYRGETARLIVADMKANGGLVTSADLESYRPRIREPLHGTYRGYEILAMPPPSSGGIVLLEMLNMLEAYPVSEMGFHSAAHLHLLVEIMRRAFANRSEWSADPEFISVPVAGLISKKFATQMREGIDPKKATPSEKLRPATVEQLEHAETTHFTIVDGEGNVVTNTYTLNGSFGSGAVARGTGILLNNEMDDFTSKPGTPNQFGLIQGSGNGITPRKRPGSSMSPTLVLKDNQPFLALGSPGGPKIPSTVFQVVSNVIDFGMDLEQAISQERIHEQWLPDKIQWEKFSLNPDSRQILEKMGHHFSAEPTSIGDCKAVLIEPKTGIKVGASDRRRGGLAVGY